LEYVPANNRALVETKNKERISLSFGQEHESPRKKCKPENEYYSSPEDKPFTLQRHIHQVSYY
jgi:hypothetical protein